jgi:hypothetical protein
MLSSTTPIVLAVNPTVPARTVKELVALIKASPGKYGYASPGTGTLRRAPSARCSSVRWAPISCEFLVGAGVRPSSRPCIVDRRKGLLGKGRDQEKDTRDG